MELLYLQPAYLYTVGLVVLQVIVHLFQLHLGLFIPEGHNNFYSSTEMSDYLLHNVKRRRFTPPPPFPTSFNFLAFFKDSLTYIPANFINNNNNNLYFSSTISLQDT
jgi:hypothetical protein